jgi:hypothetical protein
MGYQCAQRICCKVFVTWLQWLPMAVGQASPQRLVSDGLVAKTADRRHLAVSPKRSRFFLATSALFLAVVLAGFTPTFYVRPSMWPTEIILARHGPILPLHLYVHGILLTAWFVLAFVQTWLVATRRTHLHRRLGVALVVVAAGIVPISLLTTAVRDVPTIDQNPARAFGQLVTMTTFSICVVSAVYLRHRPADHKRLMWFASLSVVPPAIDRLIVTVAFTTGSFSPDREPALTGAITGCLILVMLAYDLITEKRLRRGTLLGLSAILIAIGSTMMLIPSGGWAGFVRLVT